MKFISHLRECRAAIHNERMRGLKGMARVRYESLAALLDDYSRLYDTCREQAAKLAAMEIQTPIYQTRHAGERDWHETDIGNFEICEQLSHVETRKVFLRPVPADKPAVPEAPDYKEELYQLRQKAENWSTKLGFIAAVINRRKISASEKEREFPHLLIERLHTDSEILKQRSTPSHSQQSAVYGYVVSDGFTEQFVKTLSDDDRKAAKRFNWDVIALCRCPSHEGEQGGAV